MSLLNRLLWVAPAPQTVQPAHSTRQANHDTTKDSTLKRWLHRLKLSTLLAAAAFSTTAALANNPAPRIKAEAPNVYVVQKGDTLWGISGKYLSEPWRWPEIWATNKQIKNPHRIWPGDKLILCIIKGKRVVGIDDGEGCAGLERRMTGEASPMVRYEPLSSAISAIPLSYIKPWLYNSQIVDPAPLQHVPYVLASKEGNIITAAGNKIYARGPKLIVGEDYGVYRLGEIYQDPATGDILGQEVFQIAKGLVTATEDNGVSSIELTNTYREEVREGDRVFIELTDAMPPIFYPKAGTSLRQGQIIRVMGSLGNAAKDSVVAVNIGSADGVEAGAVFAIYRKGKLVRDDHADGEAVRLPSERSGMLMIFKTFNKISYGYVLDSDIPLSIGDELRPPQGF